MKILVVTPYLSDSYGGPASSVLNLARAQSELGCDVEIITTNAGLSRSSARTLMDLSSRDNFRLRCFDCWYHNDLIISIPLLKWINCHVTNYDFVQVHTVFAPMMSLVCRICIARSIPYNINIHGMFDPWALSYKAWKKRLYYSYVEKLCLDHCSVIRVLTSIEEQQVHSLGFSKTTLAPNGIDKFTFRCAANPELFYQRYPHLCDKKIILFLGRIDPKKGLDILAPAFARAHIVFPNTHLIIAGPDSINFTPTVQTYFANVNCLDAITFTGMLTGPLKYAALSAASLYVCPSYSEGFSMSVLEGMATGLPCIITENCNFPEAHLANAAYVVPTNAQSIGDALLHCLYNPSDAQAVGQTARQFIFQNYTWERSAQKLITAYERILQAEKLSNAETFEKVA